MDGFISIDYDEFDQGSYRAVKAQALNQPNQPIERFETGDVCADFVAALAWLKAQNCKPRETVYSSSVDDFLNDGEGYRYDKQNRIVPVKVTQ